MLERSLPDRRRAELERELETPPLPRELVYLWKFYRRLHKRRGSGGMGPSAITFIDMDAFRRVTGERLTQWEVEMIEMLDDLWLAEVARARNEQLQELRAQNKNRTAR